MAIDLRVTDGVAASIETKLAGIATAADAADKQAKHLQRTLDSLDPRKLSAFNKAVLNESKIKLNNANADLASQRAQKVRAEVQLAQTKQVSEESKRLGDIAARAEKLATDKQLNAERIAQAGIRTANAKTEAQTKVVEASARAAAATTRQSYQKELLQYTPSMAQNQNNAVASRALTAQANTETALQRQQAAALRTATEFKKLEQASERVALVQTQQVLTAQRLATAQNQTATAAHNTAAAHSRQQAAASGAQAASLRLSATQARVANSTRSSSAAAVKGLNDTSTAMQRLESSASFLRSDGLRWAKVLWALGGATLTAGALVDAADAYTRVQNRLSVVADSQAKVNHLTEEMANIANRSRQPLEQTAKTFARIDLAMVQLGRAQSDSVVITENVAKSLKLGGATAGEAASAMLQLSQAFNKGKLDGDEFRSVMENSPVLADALATQLKVTRGELLKLAPEGKITAQVMADAIMGATDKINAAFAKLKPTIAESFTVLRNSAIMFFGELDKQLGVTTALATVIQGLANNLDVLTFAFLALAPVAAVFIGSKMIGGLVMLNAYMMKTAASVGAIRSPITLVAAGLANMARTGTAAGASLVAAFTAANTRAVMLQLTMVRVAAGVAMLTNVASRAGAAMMAAFSFGNVLLVLGVAIAAAIAFGDQLIVNAESGVTMRDVTIAVFQEIGDFAKETFIYMYDSAVAYFGGASDESETFGEKVGNTFFAIALAAAVTIDAISTVFNNLINGLKSVVYFLGDMIYNSVALVVNSIVSLVNGAIDSVNMFAAGANAILEGTGASALVGTFGQIGKLSGIEYKSQFLDSLGDFKMENSAAEALMLAKGRIGERAEENRKNRATDKSLRGYDAAAAKRAADAAANDKKKKKKGKSDEEKRADIIKKANIEQEKAIAAARVYGKEKAVVAAIEDVNGKLAMKNFALLSDAEKAHLRNLVETRETAERVGNIMQAMYDNVEKPMQDYFDGQAAALNLFNDGVLDADAYAGALAKVTHEYKSATDATYEFAQRQAKVEALLGKSGADRAAAEAVYDTNKSRAESGKAALTPAEVKSIEDAAAATHNLEKAQSALDSLWGETTGAQEDTAHAMNALNRAYSEGAIHIAAYDRKMAELRVTASTLNESMYGITDPFEPMYRGLNQFVANLPMLGESMAEAINSTLGNALDNVSNMLTTMIVDFDSYAEQASEALGRPVSTLETMRYALADIIKQIGTELINAMIKMGIQWAVQTAAQQAMEKASAASSAATQVSTAATIATAYAPAAAAASTATMGGAATAGLSGMTMAMLAGVALIAAMIPSFADGGLIQGAGTGRSDSILARVSNGEMVMNRKAVSSNYAMLDAMNSGQSVGGFVDNSVSVVVNVNGGSSDTQSKGEMSQFGKTIVNVVRTEVNKQFKTMTQQGHAFYK